jgi:cob(I)alamin adenosyltransferase
VALDSENSKLATTQLGQMFEEKLNEQVQNIHTQFFELEAKISQLIENKKNLVQEDIPAEQQRRKSSNKSPAPSSQFEQLMKPSTLTAVNKELQREEVSYKAKNDPWGQNNLIEGASDLDEI